MTTSSPLHTGLSDFDALAGPLPAGRVTLVAGRPQKLCLSPA
ncbi:hypothetical protein [Streptomyces sp. NPDC014764]